MNPEVEAFITEARVPRLATVDQRGRPHGVPVCFAYRDGAVYSALDAKPKRVAAQELRRVRNLLANPSVQLLVDRWDEDWSKLAYVQLRGSASLLQPGDPEQAAALELLRARYEQYAAMALESQPVIKLAVEDIVAWGSAFAAQA